MDIYREQTDEEKKLKSGGFKDVRTWRKRDIEQEGLKNIAEISQDFIYKKREPFCKRCAHETLTQRIDEVHKRLRAEAQKGSYDTDIEIKINVKNFEEFGGIKRFTLIEEVDIPRDVIISGIKQVSVTSRWKRYECNKCGSVHSIAYEIRELEEKEQTKPSEKVPNAKTEQKS